MEIHGKVNNDTIMHEVYVLAAKMNELLVNCSDFKDINIRIVQHKKDEIFGDEINDLIFKVVCEHFKIDREILQSKSRKREVVISAVHATFLLYALTGYSLNKIGTYFGNRDHSSILSRIQSHIDQFYTYADYRKEAIKIFEKLKYYEPYLNLNERANKYLKPLGINYDLKIF